MAGRLLGRAVGRSSGATGLAGRSTGVRGGMPRSSGAAMGRSQERQWAREAMSARGPSDFDQIDNLTSLTRRLG